jgi:hypothetical protein
MNESQLDAMYEQEMKLRENEPQSLPSGHGLLVLERCDHQSGDAYERRYFAVRCGTHQIVVPGEPAMKEFAVREDSRSVHSFNDCNGEYEVLLPQGSMEFVAKQWVACEVARYDY